jgi:hypothetical protein
MQKRSPGQDRLEVSAIWPGRCMGMSSGCGPAGVRQEMITLIRTVVEQVQVPRHRSGIQPFCGQRTGR